MRFLVGKSKNNGVTDQDIYESYLENTNVPFAIENLPTFRVKVAQFHKG